MADRIAASRRRTKGAESTARAEALERLKALRTGGRRSDAGFQVKIEDPIYDTVAEEDYEALVEKRREEARGFIVDDNGLGYGDEGQEEDWSQAGLPPSSDESDGEAERPKKKKLEKKEAPQKKPSPLASAAALMGKQRLSSMFTSSVFKKSRDEKTKGLSSDSIIDEVLAEFAPDEADRERRRRAQPASLWGPKICTPVAPMKVEDQLVFRAEPEVNVVASRASQIGDVENGGEGFVGEAHNEIDDGNGMLLDGGSDQLPVVNDSSANGSVAESALQGNSELKVENGEKDVGFSLNAKIKAEMDPPMSATAGWKALCSEKKGNGDLGPGEADAMLNQTDDKSDFELDSDGSLLFYMIDAHEEIFGNNAGNLYLFGKVKAGATYQSCCVVVKNMQRCVYAIPNGSIFINDVIMEMEREVLETRVSPAVFRTKLQEMASELKNEIVQKLLDLNVSTFSMAIVKRGYAFERSDIPLGENYVLKINYPFKDPPLPSGLKGEYFSALLGTHCSALELFLIKRKVMGPSWLSISNFSNCPAPQRVSWCKFEVTIDFPKHIKFASSSRVPPEIPPLIVSAINLKTVINEKQNSNEIVSASVICCQRVKIKIPSTEDKTKKELRSYFNAIWKHRTIQPKNKTKQSGELNERSQMIVLRMISIILNERALLNRLMLELHKLDSDVLVGHNISGFDLDILLHRVQVCKVASGMWSKIGRLKRSLVPKLTKGNTIYGSGASPGVLSCISGRLLCDTYLCSRDLLKEVSYSLTQLAKTQLNRDRKEIAPQDIPIMFQTSNSLMELVECGETDAWLSLELMFHLSVLPLTRQLTNISGNLWGKTLQGARAQRVEYLLLHAFHAKKYIVPDKISAREKETMLSKRKTIHGAKDEDGDSNNPPFGDDVQHVDQGKGKKGPAYAGGLVLEPKRGLYDKYILLLDFNSLYPSIIQEYNICFTTVERSVDGSAPSLPVCKATGVLPELLRELVEKRKRVKSLLKSATGLKLQQLDIRQQALKLTANSMYGCLGFSNSRFYAKPLAELITLQGREILQSTVDLVQNNLKLEVIYGDTDSIMIYTGLDDISQSKIIAGRVIQEVNKKYRRLEIDLDGLYKRMLLLKKKKYAAVKVQFRDGTPYEIIERKGLDMVRRDWSLLSKELGDFCLSQILSGGSSEDVVESIHSTLMKVQEEMRNGEVPLEKYVITKTLTKAPEAYPDAKNQPHVQVALRLREARYSNGCSAGETVPYVICCEQGSSSGSATGIASRARHPDELKRDNGNWIIDIDYYLAQQIHPVVSRLCASIEGTSPARLADCLGLDSSKFQAHTSEAASNDPSTSLMSVADDEERYRGCEPLRMSCPTCTSSFECPSISSSILRGSIHRSESIQATFIFLFRFGCYRCAYGFRVWISQQMRSLQFKREKPSEIKIKNNGVMESMDPRCGYMSQYLNLHVIYQSDRCTMCVTYIRISGALAHIYTCAHLYRCFSYSGFVVFVVEVHGKYDMRTTTYIEIPLHSIIARELSIAGATFRGVEKRILFSFDKINNISVTSTIFE
ncbi:hypothetical protein Syun_004286 [Stephania yunnanensis]|uniref:DNA polymerase n=1 Tax=Stephania yunnanensis TaxID=152371 RepID=A0AAP0L621_9MAGN